MTTLLLPAVARSSQDELKASLRSSIAGRTKRNREGWLTASLDLMRPWFDAIEAPMPAVVKVTCGWPSSRGTASRGRVIGECWSPKVSKRGYPEIFISPWLGDVDPTVVLSTLIHEAVHAAVGTEAGHGKGFRLPAVALGLEGRMTSTFAGVALTARFDSMLLKIGNYPHAKLDATHFERPVDRPKKQPTRMIKIECKGEGCGYKVRASRAVIKMGIPKCPNQECECFDIEMEVCA